MSNESYTPSPALGITPKMKKRPRAGQFGGPGVTNPNDRRSEDLRARKEKKQALDARTVEDGCYCAGRRRRDSSHKVEEGSNKEVERELEERNILGMESRRRYIKGSHECAVLRSVLCCV